MLYFSCNSWSHGATPWLGSYETDVGMKKLSIDHDIAMLDRAVQNQSSGRIGINTYCNIY